MTIFLSYSRTDAHQASDLAANLERFGYRVWIDRKGLWGGQQWMATIVQSIKEAEAFILLLSCNSVESDNVRREIDLAVNARKLIIPFEIEATRDAFPYQLAGVQRIQDWDPRGGISLVVAALRKAGVQRGTARRAKAPPIRQGSGAANVDLADLGNLGFLKRILWRHK